MKLVKTGEIIHAIVVGRNVHFLAQDVFEEKMDIWDVMKVAGICFVALTVLLFSWSPVVALAWWLWPSIASAASALW